MRRPSMRIMLVENDPKRRERFLSWPGDRDIKLPMVRSGRVAMRMLELDPPGDWHGIMLDHDLDPNPAGCEYSSGLNVAMTPAARWPRDIPIFIHSMNPDGAKYQAAFLREAGFESGRRVHFHDMVEADIVEFIDECEDYYEHLVG